MKQYLSLCFEGKQKLFVECAVVKLLFVLNCVYVLYYQRDQGDQ